MNQIALPFEWPADEEERDFIISDANRLAARHLEHWSLWPVMATIVTGPRKSGRSLLGRIFARKTGGVLADGAEQVGEEELFHAWNRAQEDRRPLIMIADAPPPAWCVRLPDLRSRLAATPHVAIEEPDDALAGALIEKLLVSRGLPPPPDLARFLLPRIERTYVSIIGIVDALDELALSRRQRITLPLVRQALALAGVIDDSSIER